MVRAKVERVILVNWKGVVYDEIELDPAVTAMEGENGAGKTTVMIAAYTVLIPDVTLLHFAGERDSHAATGENAIWGRLGRTGPSYAWLEIKLPDQRVIVGVHLRRLAKPRLEVEPFIIEKVPASVNLENLLMHKTEDELRVPEPEDIVTLALTAGAEITSFGDKKKDYFSKLFDLGITPLRMAAQDERRNMNEMLHTCMMGGISKTLGTGLRDFLFTENARLADTVRRMSQNLKACRLTRAQVERTTTLEVELSELYKAGQGAFLLALHGTRTWEAEAKSEVAGLVEREAVLAAERDEKQREFQQVVQALLALGAERQIQQDRLVTAEGNLQRTKRALELRQKLDSKETTRVAVAAHLAILSAAFKSHEEQLLACKERERAALRRHADAASALASFEEGYRELSRKVAAYRHATKQLDVAREVFEEPHSDISSILSRLEEHRIKSTRLANEAHVLALRVADLETHAKRFADGRTALEEVLGQTILEANVGAALVEADEARSRDTLEFGRLEDYTERLADAKQQQELQDDVRRRVDATGLVIDSSEELESMLSGVDEACKEVRERLDTARRALASAKAIQKEDAERLSLLRERLAPWRNARRICDLLSPHYGSIGGMEDALKLEQRLIQELESVRRQLEAAESASTELQRRSRQLEGNNLFAPHVLRARDLVGAELVAESFEDVPLATAGSVEASLGDLVNGLIVRDTRRAAAALSKDRTLAQGESVLLLQRVPSLDGPEVMDDGSVLVSSVDNQILRISQPRTVPTLGRAARERAVSELKVEVRAYASKADALTAVVERMVEDLRLVRLELFPVGHLLSCSDPSVEIAVLETKVDGQRAQETEWLRRETAEAAESERLATLLDNLRALLPVRALLNPPNFKERVEKLSIARAAAHTAGTILAKRAPHFSIVDRLRDTLRAGPNSTEATQGLLRTQANLELARLTLARGLSALEDLAHEPAALDWGHFLPVLEDRVAMKPTMEAEIEGAIKSVQEIGQEIAEANARRDEAQAKVAEESAKHQIVLQSMKDLEVLLDETGISGPDERKVENARSRFQAQQAVVASLDTKGNRLSEAKGELKEKLSTLIKDHGSTQDQLSQRRQELERRERIWLSFQNAVRDERLDLDALISRIPEGTGSPNLFANAGTQRRLVASLLRRSSKNDELVSLYDGIDDSAASVSQVRAWAALRRHLHRRIPADISECPDVVQGLAALVRHLKRLKGTLEEQESGLRTDVNAIAYTIRSQRRAAGNRLRELTEALKPVRFGSIRKIELEMKHIEKMNELLAALAPNKDMFFTERPFEQVLNELFERIGGGGVKADRLLDYRQYFTVEVAVERMDGEKTDAQDDEMSTGEAIGVGAAVMMIVLKAWEEDAGSLRKALGFGALRFLFLDEATRLSRASLLVLFDLCSRLELQLLIAAPSVDRVEGATTYTFVRGIGAGGRESVDIHGRRVKHGLGG